MRFQPGSGIKAVITVALMLTVFPFATLTVMTLARDPDWSKHFLLILFMWVFGVLIPGPFWITGVPVVATLPLVMGRISRRPGFRACPRLIFILISTAAGALLGALVMLPAVLIGDPPHPRWEAYALLVPYGAAGGLVTLPWIAWLYRASAPQSLPTAIRSHV